MILLINPHSTKIARMSQTAITTSVVAQNNDQSDELRLTDLNTSRSTLASSSLRNDDVGPNFQDSQTQFFESIPDGGYGWWNVFAGSAFLFWTNGFASTFGVWQANILRSSYLHVQTSQITFVGGLALACLVAFGVPSVQLFSKFGARRVCVISSIFLSAGPILTSFTLSNLGGLFCTAGVLSGAASCVLYTASNSVPVQWFSSKLGLANGLIKAGGGVGATVLPVIAQKLIDSVGLPWAYRIFGFLMLVTTLPASLLIKERAPVSSSLRVDLSSLRKNISFLCLTVSGGIIVFALYVPPFFLPLFSQSIGLPPSTGAALVAGFGASTTVGRLISGFACDRIGPLNCLVLTAAINAISMLAIWPVSDSLGTLVLFAVLNGCGNGSFFVAMPTAIAAVAGPGVASSAMSIGTSFWSPGYLLGTSIAGILITSTGADKASNIEPYRAAIFYSGGVALAGGLFAIVSRFQVDHKINKKV